MTSLTGKRWLITPQDKETAQKLSSRSRISSILAQVLINRGIMSTPELDAFVTPKISFLTNPYDIPDMEKAAKRVMIAKEKGEKVAVYGDYDVDGVTGTAIVYLTLQDLKIECTYYIPHRYNEGYGMNNDAVDKLNAQGVKLIITVDCGISNIKEIEHANSLGIDVIVTDHHTPQKQLPAAYAAIDSKLTDIPSPVRDLSGAGVAFKFAWALYRTAGIKDSSNLMDLFDLAGLGTIADIVPLLDENRIMAVYGLKALNNTKRLGIKKLIESAGIKKRITTSQVNFMIAPRLNSAGRMDHASLSVDLLITKDEMEASRLALELSRLNTQRQSVGKQIQAEAFAMISEVKGKAIILCGKSWSPGVIGIVASQIVEKYYKPAVLIGVSEGVGRGSARSIEGLNIFEALGQCRDLFNDFGGHKKAAGFEINEDKIPEFIERLNKIIDEALIADDLMPKLDIDSVIEPGEISLSLASELELLSPYGEENPAPTFMSNKLKLVDMKRVGDGSHLKARFTDGSMTLDCIAFSKGHLADKMKPLEVYDLAYNLEVNEFNGFETAQLNMVDIRSAE